MPASPSFGSAAVPDPDSTDHVRGSGPAAVVYLDLACPRCAGIWTEISVLPLELCVRHFPVASKRPRSAALHAAAEAVALQSEPAFWEFWDSLLADRAHVDDPHLWERVRELGLDLDRFQRDRASDRGRGAGPARLPQRHQSRRHRDAGRASPPVGRSAPSWSRPCSI